MALLLDCGAMIDEADWPLVQDLVLRVRPTGHVEFKRRKTHMLHRYLIGAKPGQYVDHINGNPLDNRRCNLRVCTHAENMQNRRIHSNNTTGFKGVWFDVRRNKFRAQIQAFKKVLKLGSFERAEDAYAAYVAKAVELHGPFARLR